MTPSKYAFQAGLFILLSIAAAMLLVAKVAETRSRTPDARNYIAVVTAGEDIAGLSEGAEVRLMGLKVGRVESIQIVTPERPEDDAQIHIGFSVGNGVELRQNAPQVELQTALTGGAWLNILSLGTGEALADGDAIVAKSSNVIAIMSDVRDELQMTLSNVRGEIDQVANELIETSNDIESLAENADKLILGMDERVDHLLDESAQAVGDVRSIFGDSGEDMRTTLAKLSSLTTKLDTKLPETIDEMKSFVTKAETSIDGVDTLMAELTGTATEARTLLADNRTDIDRTIESARRSVDELEGLVDDLRANPSRLIWPPDEKDMNNNALYAIARSYAKAAEDLESAAGALHKATEDDNADPEKIKALKANVLQQFEHFDKLQKEVWERFEQ